jgi:hypothetical protein
MPALPHLAGAPRGESFGPLRGIHGTERARPDLVASAATQL